MRRSRLVPILVWPLLFVAGCGGGDGDAEGDDDDPVGPEIPEDPEAGEFATLALVAELDVVLLNLLLPGAPAECLTVVPSPPADSDGDGVPDDAVYTFDLQGCRTDLGGGAWVSNAGEIRVTDPGQAWGLDASLDAYGYWNHRVEEGAGLTIGREHTGATRVSGSGAAASFLLDHDVLYRVTGEPDATLAEDWSGTFTPSGGAFPFHLVPGTLTLAGSSTFSRGSVSIRLSLETVTPLRWEATCESPWPLDGTVRAHVTSGGPAGYLEIRYTGCWNMGEAEFVGG